MTDKDTIINRVDVSGCEFLITSNNKQLCRCIKSDLFGGIEFVENAKSGNCKDNPNCYYKQLKRAEAQCEDMFVKHTDLEMKYKQKEQECNKWENAYKVKEDALEEAEEYTEELEEKYHKLQQQLDQLKAELEQEKALKETYLACYKTKHEDIEGELFKLRQYKASKQASYEVLQKKCNELELKNRELKKCYKNNSALLDFEETNTTKLVNKVMKLEQTLTEIKEVAEPYNDMSGNCVIVNCFEDMYKILQKISEVIKDE